ncbi:Aluminum resistance family protein [Thermincola ferriacetica]|uniref:Aluminum resistance family protein n=1 Tax=Thermincola ferriacetica TaxID=281456 RepID=A0A0L6W6W7_9FIRM|nr:aminotransferase class V-fold PLP-dependent enzyme [Thermincola ferriacetica]KNZ70844.1 Aluminum resistance family protein [Thermincola ferriacetica]
MNLEKIVLKTEEKIQPVYNLLDKIAFKNHEKVLQAFNESQVTDYHLKGSTGYGYSDAGRTVIEKIFSIIFRTEAALVRGQITTGTHAIAVGLFGNLRPGDELLSVTGAPYDTLQEVIGIRGESPNSLKNWGVTYRQVDLTEDGQIDLDAVKKAISPKTKIVFIQRSRGYAWRNALRIQDIGSACKFVKEINPSIVIFVDNCYGELVEVQEPTEVGADLVAGSLIKNLGGGLAPTGGYLAGRESLIKNAAERLTAPGIGAAVGATSDWNRWFLQGVFLAPHVVCEALKGAVFTAALFEELGYDVLPKWNDYRSDLIQSIRLGSAETMVSFCEALQQASPIDSHVLPQPWDMPGYDCQVIMAGGTFVQGATIELSADGPIREPYAIYLQGGLSKDYVKIAAIKAARKITS